MCSQRGRGASCDLERDHLLCVYICMSVYVNVMCILLLRCRACAPVVRSCACYIFSFFVCACVRAVCVVVFECVCVWANLPSRRRGRRVPAQRTGASDSARPFRRHPCCRSLARAIACWRDDSGCRSAPSCSVWSHRRRSISCRPPGSFCETLNS